MRMTARLLMAAVLSVAVVATADAQNRQRQPGQQRQGQRGQGGMMGMGGMGMNVFAMVENNKALQDEIKITDEQKDKLKEAMKPIAEKRRELFQGFRPGGERPTEEQMKEMREKGEKLAADTKKAVEEVLKPEQTKRLTQIGYQVMGVNAFTNKEVQTSLKMSEEQVDKAKAVIEEYNKDAGEIRRSAFGGGGGDREEMMKKMQENQKKIAALGKEAEEKIMEKMSDDQKKSWKEMQGEKFDTAKLMQFGGRPMRRDN